MRDLQRAVVTLADGQLGLVTVRQLDDVGVPRGLRQSWVRRGWLVAVRRGVYRLVGARMTVHARIRAVLLASSPAAVASHVTAARLLGLGPALREASAREHDRHGSSARARSVEALHLIGPRQVRIPGVIGHVRVLDPDELGRVGLVPVTTMERTLFDLAALLDPPALGVCVDEALRRGADLRRVRQILERHGGPGQSRRWPLGVVLTGRPVGYDPGANAWERQMDDRWEALGLPAAERQYPVLVGGRRYVLDRALPEIRLGVEWNGFGYHGRRSKFDSDSYRRADLQAAGWELIEVTSSWTPERLRRVVQEVVSRRRGQHGSGAGAVASTVSPRSGTPSRAR